MKPNFLVMLKKIAFVFFFISFTQIGFAVLNVGDASSFIVEELGEPSAKMNVGGKTVYSYSQGSIHVREGKIIAISDGFYGSEDHFTRKTATGEEIELVRSAPEPTGVVHKWLENPDDAFAASKSSGKPVLILFTGSDWCVWCKKLESEVLGKPEFLNQAANKYVLLEVDFPQRKLISEEAKARNDALKSKWNVEGFPTVILVDSEGVEMGRTGYNGMLANEYLAHLNELQQSESENEFSEKVRNLLGDDAADLLGDMGGLNSLTGGAVSLSIQLLLGSVMTFFFIRRFMRR